MVASNALARAAAVAGRPLPEAPSRRRAPAYRWFGADLKTGVIIEELPFIPSGPLTRMVGEYSTLQGVVVLPAAPAGWEQACDPARTMLVCVRADDEQPMWAGIVLTRKGGSGDTVELSLVTLEGYLDRRYVQDRAESQRDGAQIALDLAWDAMGGTYGLGMAVGDFTGSDTGVRHDRNYYTFSDQTALSQLTELMNVINGPEWTMWVEWKDADRTTFRKRFDTRRRIGAESNEPTAVFDMPGSIREYSFSEDYTSGRGANFVAAFGDGEGDSRPFGNPMQATELLTAGYPMYEYRQTYTSVTSASVLTQHAMELLNYKDIGARSITVTADAATGPVLFVDWALGDDVAIQIESSPRHPDGLSLVRRAVGWELDTLDGTVTPILLEERERDYEQIL